MAQKRRQVSLQIETWQKAVQLRDALAQKSGRRVSIGDIVHRGLECLQDAHERGAWLSPAEAAPVMEQRLRDRIASALAQFVARAMPDKRLVRIVVYPPGDTMDVVLEDASIPVLLGPAEAEMMSQ